MISGQSFCIFSAWLDVMICFEAMCFAASISVFGLLGIPDILLDCNSGKNAEHE